MNENVGLHVCGYCKRDLFALIKKVEAWNQGNTYVIFCTEWNLIDIFDNQNMFGKHEIRVDEQMISNIRAKYDYSDCIVVGKYPYTVIGVLELN
jgi:hypothetical protein